VGWVCDLRNRQWGLLLIVLGIAGLVAWCIGAEIVFQYLVTEVYGRDPGEAIWFLAPHYTLLAIVPAAVLLFGICTFMFSTIET
jgi:hypothetical protein